MTTPRRALRLLALCSLPLTPVFASARAQKPQPAIITIVAPNPAKPAANSICSGMGLGSNGPLNGFLPSPTDAWHQVITSAPVDPNSAKIISTAADLGNAHLHPDFGTQAGIPYVVVDSRTQPSIPVTINLYRSESDITVAPVPANAPVEGNPLACTAPSSDQHLLVLDRADCVAYEYWQASTCQGAWTAANVAAWNMNLAEHRPYTYTSADAAGLSVFEGLIRYDEIIAGSINHAIRFTAQHTKTGAQGGYFVAPATHSAGNLWGTDNIIGMRIRLKAGVDLSKFSKTNQIILTAMKKYGMILADNGSNLFFQGTPDNRWDDNDLNALKSIPSTDFEVVQMGAAETMYKPPTGPAPVITSFTASATTVKAGTSVTLSIATSGSSYVYIDQVGVLTSPTVLVKPVATTTYTLTGRNAYGTVSRALTVTVVP